MKRPIQIVTVIFSLSLFTGYVVYSQLTRSNAPASNFAPSSKSRQIDLVKQASATDQAAVSNATGTNMGNGGVITNSTNAAPIPAPQPFLPGSKSAAIFVPADTAALALNSGLSGITNVSQVILQPGSTTMMPSSKVIILTMPVFGTNNSAPTNPAQP